jgi:SulP family sulfate permease
MASDMLEELDQPLNAKGISPAFAELKDPVPRKIEPHGLTNKIDPRHFFPAIKAAVTAYQMEPARSGPPSARVRQPGPPG